MWNVTGKTHTVPIVVGTHGEIPRESYIESRAKYCLHEIRKNAFLESLLDYRGHKICHASGRWHQRFHNNSL